MIGPIRLLLAAACIGASAMGVLVPTTSAAASAATAASVPDRAAAARASRATARRDRVLTQREANALGRKGHRIGAGVRRLAKAGAPIAEQRTYLDTKLRASLPRNIAKQVLAEAIEGIALEATPQLRSSHLGGSALAAPGETWPVNTRSKVPLALVAVLDLAELKAPAPLPPEGSLVLYYDAKGPEVEDGGPTSHWLDITTNAEVRWIPPGTPATEVVPPATTLSYPRRSLSGYATLTYGGYGNGDGPALYGTQYNVDRAGHLVSGIQGAASWTEQLLGASTDLQTAVIDELPYSFQRPSIYASERVRYSADERRGRGWTLIAQISGGGSEDMYFGDMGIVSFLVPTADLKERRFDRVVSVLQF